MSEPSIVSVVISTVLEENDVVIQLVDSEDQNFFINTNLVEFGRGLKLKDIDKLTGNERNELRDIIQSSISNGFIVNSVVVNDIEYLVTSFCLNNLMATMALGKTHKSVLYTLKSIDPDRSVVGFYAPINNLENSLVDRIQNKVMDASKFSFLDLVRLVGLKNILIIMLVFITFSSNPLTESKPFEKFVNYFETVLGSE